MGLAGIDDDRHLAPPTQLMSATTCRREQDPTGSLDLPLCLLMLRVMHAVEKLIGRLADVIKLGGRSRRSAERRSSR